MIPAGRRFRYCVMYGCLYAVSGSDTPGEYASVQQMPLPTPPEILPEELMDDDQAIDFMPTGQSWMSPILAMFGNNHAVPAKAIAIVLTQRNCGNCANSAKTAPVPRCGLCCGANSRQSEWRNLNAC